VITVGTFEGGTRAAQSSASIRVIERGVRVPNSARNAFNALSAVSMLDPL